jgi:FG-GAP-like repeat
MADITLGQTITGSLTSDDPKYSNGITVYDRYNFVGLDDARQLTIKVNRNLFDGFEIVLRNADTGKVIDYTVDAIGSGSGSISATTFPGINYSLEVSDFNGDFSFVTGTYYNITNGFGPYTLSTVDGGKATSIVTTDKVQRNLDNVGIPRVGTVGADGKFFPLASDISATVTDVALSATGQFYGIDGGVFLVRIDPSQQVNDQIQYANGIAALSTIKPVGGSATWKIDAIEFANNKLYALYRTDGVDKLYTIDTTIPAPSITAGFSATLVGDLPAGFVTNGDDLVYDAANNRFLATATGTTTSDALWQIPIGNPAGATSIGLIGSTDLTGLNFENGQLMGFTSKADGTGSKISIDPNTGAGTLVQAISGITNLSGAATIPFSNARNDFNGDRKTDLLWRNTDGSVAIWQLNGTTVTPKSVATLTNDWTIAGTGDFNRDRNADILLSNTNGSVAVWQMNGGVIAKTSTIGTLTSGWSIAGTADFNGDGKADVLLRNTNGTVAQWQTDGSTVTQASTVGSLSADWTVAGTADFTGDSKADILLLNTNGTIALWEMDGATVVKGSSVGILTSGWSIAGTGDFTGDGKSDLLFRNTNGNVAGWQMNGAAVAATAVVGSSTADWKMNGTGDINGDGKADILWRNDDGRVATWQMNGATVLAAGATSIPFADTSWQIVAPIL